MKVVAFNGSPRPEGNTACLIGHVFSGLEAAGIETEMFHVGGQPVRGCIACYRCFANQNGRCAVDEDRVNEWIGRMTTADGILMASPTYFTDVTSEMKALIDRAGLVARANGHFLRRKVGAAVVAVRRAGAIHVFDTLNHFFLISQMIVPGSSYWNIGIGRNPGEVEGDPEGLQTMADLGGNMAWLMQRLEGDKS
jgi:multimeric flavodoxin WrbA